MQTIKEETILERDRPTDSPYSYKIVKIIVQFFEKHGLFRFTIKIPHFLIRFIALLAGVILFTIGPWKKLVSKNLTIMFRGKLKEKYGKKLARKIKKSMAFMNAKNMARTFVEDLFYMPALTVYKDFYKNKVIFDGPNKIEAMKRVEDAWKLGKGVVLVSIHSAAFIIMSCSLGYYYRAGKFPIKPVQTVEEGSMDAYIDYMRGVIGVALLKQGEKVDRKSHLYDVVKNKGILMLAIDLGHKNYPKIPLFGVPASTPIGPAQLNYLFDCPVLPCYNIPHPKKAQWIVYAGEPIKFKKFDKSSGLSEREIIEENSKIVNKALEKLLWKSYPYWMYLMLMDKLKKMDLKKK
ncbi:MAG: hypothetical protein EAX96_00100 [Candidatus Lokiarchaeota archaeon]|nr:hypothetical protein [Candidatus Lokiarchaeota archaeon]